MARAFSRAWANTGKRIAARMAMMAITTSSSISVKAGSTFISVYYSLLRARSIPDGAGVAPSQCCELSTSELWAARKSVFSSAPPER